MESLSRFHQQFSHLMPKPNKRAAVSQPISLQEWTGIAGIVFFLAIFLYYLYRRCTASSRKYKQTNPYVATVDLHERYGGLEKRAVSISDLSIEQLSLLRRDGKLNSATVEKLVRQGRLPKDENQDIDTFIAKRKSLDSLSESGSGLSSAGYLPGQGQDYLPEVGTTHGLSSTTTATDGSSSSSPLSEKKQSMKQRKGKPGKGKKK